MNLKKIDLKELVKKLKPKKREFRSLSVRAAFDWKIILAVFVLLLAGSIVWHVIVFLGIEKIDSSAAVSGNSANQSLVNEKGLAKIIEFYDSKKSKFEEIRSKPPILTDPSR